MTETSPLSAPTTEASLPVSEAPASADAINEVSRRVNIIHASLVGMVAIVVVLLCAIALPAFGWQPVDKMSFAVMAVASLVGICYFYYVNFRVHHYVGNQARLTEVLVNSLGQGFFSFDRNGVCGKVYSQACVHLLETIPSDKKIVDVLRVNDDQRKDFKEWMEILFMPGHALSFDDVVKFLPQFYPHSKNRRISLLYRPIRNNDGLLTDVVVIATDQTEEHEAQQRVQKQQNYADMICRIFKERNQFHATLLHARKFIDMSSTVSRAEDQESVLRMLHILKAAVKHFYLEDLGQVVHRLESDLRSEGIKTNEAFLDCLRDGRQKVAIALGGALDQVRELIGQDYERRGNMHEVEESAIYDFAHEMEARNADPFLMRNFLRNIAAVPAQDCFRQFEHGLYDLAEITGKQVKRIRYTGTDPRVLTQPINDFLFSLTHICRNIVDHGIEPPVTRLARGKDPAGQVSIHIDIIPDPIRKMEWLHFIISDDGNGIDPSKVRAKLAMLDPKGTWKTEDDHTVIQRIFSWGFSTSETVTELSGRGVGLEVVDKEVKALGGSITVFSELYRGVRFDIKIPYILELAKEKHRTVDIMDKRLIGR